MSGSAPLDFNSVITNPTVRRTVYGLYATSAVAAGAMSTVFSTLGGHQPSWLTAALAVIAYLGVPVGGLALANVSHQAAGDAAAAAADAAPAPTAGPVLVPAPIAAESA